MTDHLRLIARQLTHLNRMREYLDYPAQREKSTSLYGLTGKSALVREALKALIERESAQRLALLGGSEPTLEPAPRRRSMRVK